MTAAVLALPGLWAGLILAAACVAGSLWLRPTGREASVVASRARRRA